MALRERTQLICSTWKRRKAAGERERDIVRDLANSYGIQRPAIWKALRAGGEVAPYGESGQGTSGRPKGGGIPGYTALRNAGKARAEEAKADKERPPVDVRPATVEPCRRCGVRADVGCKHQRAVGPVPLAIAGGEK